jgi:hypothetical protein
MAFFRGLIVIWHPQDNIDFKILIFQVYGQLRKSYALFLWLLQRDVDFIDKVVVY